MPKKSKVIVIIPCFNGHQYLTGLMPGLMAEKYSDFDLEILVVDNNSSDDSVLYLKENFPSITIIINQKNTGYVGANNLGYDYAKKQDADFIYLLNHGLIVGWYFWV